MKFYFIGIGGIGVSALARYYLEKGHDVNGSDLIASEITESLAKKGAKLSFGSHKEENFPENTDLVIYSPAIQTDNLEIKKAKKLGIKCQSYPEALGDLIKKHFTIAVSGTHGKSTTTAMLGILLTKAGFDPTVIVGTKVREFNPSPNSGQGSNCRVGKSEYLVVEADEHFASFLNYWPKIIVLTTIEVDHLDYYKNINNILLTFKKYIAHLPADGKLIINWDDKNIREIISDFQFPISNQFSIFKYQLSELRDAEKLKKILKVPGEYNVHNALAALTTARALKIPDKVSFKALSEYRGSWRRFEEIKSKIGKSDFIIIHDYGHHPTEVGVTLKAAREKYLKKRIWCVFQPHQYQRTYYLFNDFIKNFRLAPVDKVIITDIYDVAGREEKKIKEKVSSEKLVMAIKKKNIIYFPKEAVLNHIKQNISEIDVLIVMGAGDIYEMFSNAKFR